MDKKVIICISRQYGSGGHEVGQRLAEQLGIPFYDRNLLTKTASEHDVSEAAIETADERPVNWLSLGLSAGTHNPYRGNSDDAVYYAMNDRVFYMEAETIKHIADEGSCVIVGRTAEEVLKENPDMISIFVHGAFADRVQRIMAVEGSDQAKAEQLVRKMDRKRASYHNYYSDCKWGEATTYHCSISTSRFGIDGAVAAIRRLVEVL